MLSHFGSGWALWIMSAKSGTAEEDARMSAKRGADSTGGAPLKRIDRGIPSILTSLHSGDPAAISAIAASALSLEERSELGKGGAVALLAKHLDGANLSRL